MGDFRLDSLQCCVPYAWGNRKDETLGGKNMSNRVKERREQAGLTQVELARRVHVASPNLSAIENEQRVAWPLLRRRLARSLKTTEADLFPIEQTAGIKNAG